MFNQPKKTAIIIFTGLVATDIIWQLYKRSRSKRRKSINEVIIFSEELSGCRMHAVTRLPCARPDCSVTSMRKLCAYMGSAQRKLSVCMYLLSSEDLAAAVTRAYLRGVIVRVIVDASMAENEAYDRRLRVWQEKGIKVRMKSSEFLMHHKFVIIDEELLLSGSANWTMQALHGNWENIIVSNHAPLVKPFVKEFDRMWTLLTKDED